ncbi:hypothetical protein BOTBODRAFT_100856 [Botryobasidium botryosum FD-172 SS1]|uniref:Uncharacterized protein n=1 Tax=Botryobasidium botryosum (strain FD-172 SS1) TaxID=930990 RepID=A0A067N1H6_BOTB1|nr:hypothetical protein BOTBODRAFT_100856 [Botryobasidium botryosum FD-172 SS1]
MSTPHLQRSTLYDVSGQVALVTGGGSGIGLMMAQGLATNGAKVYIGGRRAGIVKEAAKSWEGDGKLIPITLDVTDKESILAAVSLIEAADGRLDILINNAGQVGPKHPFLSASHPSHPTNPKELGLALFNSASLDDWSSVFNANVSSIYFVTTAFLGLLSVSGKSKQSSGGCASVLNISSISGTIKVAQNHFAYNSTKAATTHLTKLLSTEFVRHQLPIRINGLAPGLFPTEMTSREKGAYGAEEAAEYMGSLHPLWAGRSGRDNEIVAAAMYFASPASYYTTGQVLIVDGGFVAVNPSTE